MVLLQHYVSTSNGLLTSSDGRSIAYSVCLTDAFIYFQYIVYHLTRLCNNFYGLSHLFGYWSSVFKRKIMYNFSIVCPFDYTLFVVSGKVGMPSTGITTPVGWLSLLKQAVLNRSAIVEWSKVLWLFVLSRCFLDCTVGVVAFAKDWVRSLPFSLHCDASTKGFFNTCTMLRN